MALKNVGASVRARLLRMAQERHESFEGLLVRFVHERLLYRLGRSEQATRFALKGAPLFPLWGPEVPRATRDLDLLWHEVVIAEKFQAMVDLGMDNSRMKDYFDIDVLGRLHAFQGARLARALEATFRRRRFLLPVVEALAAGQEWSRNWPVGGPWLEH